MLLEKTAELISAKASVAMLTKQLADASGHLQNAEQALTISDAALQMKSTELLSAIENLIIANEQLRQSRDLQNAFIMIAAHELRTPIQPLLGVADLIDLSNVEDNDKIELSGSHLKMIVRNVNRLERLSNDILDASKIEGHSLRLQKERFDLNQEITDIVRDFQVRSNNSEAVQILFKPSPSLESSIMISADKSRIYEVISNILSNAIKFTENGSITIFSEIDKNAAAKVRIKDTGRGISQELFPHLFVKFGIADASDTRSGSGLGLFISKGIIDAHGGELWAENNNDGRGATFTFTIPTK